MSLKLSNCFKVLTYIASKDFLVFENFQICIKVLLPQCHHPTSTNKIYFKTLFPIHSFRFYSQRKWYNRLNREFISKQWIWTRVKVIYQSHWNKIYSDEIRYILRWKPWSRWGNREETKHMGIIWQEASDNEKDLHTIHTLFSISQNIWFFWCGKGWTGTKAKFKHCL